MGLSREHQPGAFSTEVVLLEEKAFPKHTEVFQLSGAAFCKNI